MTREETTAILSILKAAYPNAYKGLTRKDANGIITVWQMQFADISMNIILMAVNKYISTNPYAPAVSDIKNKLRDLYYEAQEMLIEHNNALNNGIETVLDNKSIFLINKIIEETEYVRYNNNEMTLFEMLTNNNNYLNPGEKEEKYDV